MAFQDRHYYRDQSGRSSNPLMWLLTGSVPLFSAFGIRVRAHASLILYAVIVLLIGIGEGFAWQDRVENVTLLFGIVLLHEFGHCFTARWVGGDANDILLWPLGGLAYANPPRRPLPTFLTVLGGPAVNFLICVICAAIIYGTYGTLPWHWNPLMFHPIHRFFQWDDAMRYVIWIYQISYMLLIFNLMPIYPLDGGQMLQCILWPKFGYYKSMMFSCITGMVCSVVGGMIALATWNIGLAILAACGFLMCFQMRQQLLANGPEEYADDGIDYSAAYEIEPTKSRRRHRTQSWSAKRAAKRAAKLMADERDERQRIDAILAKVSAHGMNSLTRSEKKTLKLATEHQRQRDLEMGRPRT